MFEKDMNEHCCCHEECGCEKDHETHECECEKEVSKKEKGKKYSQKEVDKLNDEISKWQEQFGKAMATAAHHENLSKYYKNEKGNVFGILDNQSDKMCRGCDRFRMSANGFIKVCNFLPIDLKPYIEKEEDLEKELLKLGEYLDSRGKDYIGKRLHKNDYNFRWNHPEKNK